nr:hypothetical protein [Tanacetum cinerariifolium]
IYVGTDKKRCHNRLTKGRMDFDYCKQVQEELLSSMKSVSVSATVTPRPNYYARYSYWSMRLFSDKQYKQIVLNQLAKARTVRRGQLNLQLDLLRKKIRCKERVLEQISLRMKKAYKGAYKLGEQQNEKSSYTEYKSLMTYVKELARREDIEELMQVCDRLF